LVIHTHSLAWGSGYLPLNTAWIVADVTIILSENLGFYTGSLFLRPTGTKAAGYASGLPVRCSWTARSTTIKWPEGEWGHRVRKAGKSGFSTTKEQAKAPETERFQAFFLIFFNRDSQGRHL